MDDWNLNHELAKAFVSSFGSLLTLGIALVAGWLISSPLSYRWNTRQKNREIQLSALQQFYVAYGEFFAVWKLWNPLIDASEMQAELRWELHKRAAAAEALIEGTLVKLSCELRLEKEDIDTLGRFRQGFQTLREVIRAGNRLPWDSSGDPEYIMFKRLTTRVSSLLAREWKGQVSAEKAAEQLLQMTSNRFEHTWAAPFE